MSKTLEEQMLNAIDSEGWSEGCLGHEGYAEVGHKDRAAKECSKLAKIYALEQQIELLQEVYKNGQLIAKLSELRSQLKSLKDE